MSVDPRLHLRLRVVVCVLLAGGFTEATAQTYRYVQPVRPVLNATSWHGSFATRTKCVSIRYSGHSPRVRNPTDALQYTIISRYAVRLEDRDGLFDFFERHPKDRYEIVAGGIRREYRHNPDSAAWRENLKRVADLEPVPATPPPAVPSQR